MEESMIKRIPPHSLEAEKSLIGCMLYSAEAIGPAIDVIKDGREFYQHNFGIMFDTLKELQTEGRGTDIVSLQNALKMKPIPPEAYTLDILKDLLSSVFTTANVENYAQIVHEKYILRELIKATEDVMNRCYLEKEAVEDIIKAAEDAVFDTVDSESVQKIETMKEVVLRTVKETGEAAKNPDGAIGIPSGFTDLDSKTLGFQKGQYVILAARPSMGKTALALNMATYMAMKKKLKVAFFDLEMSREDLTRRMLASESHVNSKAIRSGKLTDRDWQDIMAASSMLAGMDFYIDDAAGLSIAQFISRAQEYKAKYDVDVIFVDYIQLLSGKNAKDRQNEVREISAGIKYVARKLNVPVIALSQLSRDSAKGNSGKGDIKRPQMTDLRDSGSLEQDADIVMFLHREDYYNKDSEEPGKTELIISKNRNGETGTVYLTWIPELTKFSNAERVSAKTDSNS